MNLDIVLGYEVVNICYRRVIFIEAACTHEKVFVWDVLALVYHRLKNLQCVLEQVK